MGAIVRNFSKIVYKIAWRGFGKHDRMTTRKKNKGARRPMSSSTASEKYKRQGSSGRASAAPGARVQSIHRSILEAVVEHRLPPGAKLTEAQLGGVFGVSRTIVRSALQALARDHIVTLAPHRGAFVSAPTIEDAHDLFAARKLVEPAIAREVARRVTAEQIASLSALLAEEHAALHRRDRRTAIRLSGAFHVAVAATCCEGVLTTFLLGLISRSSLVIALYGRSQASVCGHDDHIAFLSALEERDGERAERLMTEHLDHILGDLDLNPRDETPVDVAAVLRAKLTAA
jgi:DNA-binding GntR family transcriptional regulator